MNRALTIALVAMVATGCRESKVQKIAPTLGLDAIELDFGAVRVGTQATRTLNLSAANGADVLFSEITLEGSPVFTLDTPPTSLRGLTTEPLTLHFSPTAGGDLETTLIIKSDDEIKPEVRVPLKGRGAFPHLELIIGCETSALCEATVTVTFAPEPFVRLRPNDPATLAVLRLRSTGEVPAVVTGLSLGGVDRAAFSFIGNAALPDGGLVQFRPTSDSQQVA